MDKAKVNDKRKVQAKQTFETLAKRDAV